MSHSNKQSVAKLHRKEFDLLSPSRHVTIRAIELPEIAEAARFASAHLSGLQIDDLSRLETIIARGREQVQLFHARDRLVGLYAMLFLNRDGLESLLSGTFDGANPCIDHLVEETATPAAIYTWFVACPGRAVSGFGNVARLLRSARLAGADLFARPASDAGLRLMRGIGYTPIGSNPAGLHRYIRIQNRTISRKAA